MFVGVGVLADECTQCTQPHTQQTPKPESISGGYPPFRGSVFWSQSSNKYQIMPIKTSNPKPDPNIRSGFGPRVTQNETVWLWEEGRRGMKRGKRGLNFQ